MKKLFTLIGILVIGLVLSFNSLQASDNPVFSTLDSQNVVIETCTGTWCQYCPCGHTILTGIIQTYPRTVALCYHGPTGYGDPWATVGYPMIQQFGMTSYPTGVIQRSSGIISRSSWNAYVSMYSAYTPTVRVELSNAQINVGTRTITGTITSTALTNLTGGYKIFVAITENNLIYAQTGNSGCPGGTNYVHDHVVRALVTPTTGTSLTAGPWNQGTALTYNLNYVIPAGIDLNNIDVNYIVYFDGAPYTTGANVQNGLRTVASAYTVTGIGKLETVPEKYELGQNYPNPFNPTTNIRFSIPKDGNVVFKVYDIKGKEVATYQDGFLKAGSYNVTLDASFLGSGVYFYKLSAGNFTDTKRMILVK